MEYNTRKEQIEAEDLRDIVRAQPLTVKAFRARAAEVLRDVALLGAHEERGRTLEIISAARGLSDEVRYLLVTQITAQGVNDVLGYSAMRAAK